MKKKLLTLALAAAFALSFSATAFAAGSSTATSSVSTTTTTATTTTATSDAANATVGSTPVAVTVASTADSVELSAKPAQVTQLNAVEKAVEALNAGKENGLKDLVNSYSAAPVADVVKAEVIDVSIPNMTAETLAANGGVVLTYTKGIAATFTPATKVRVLHLKADGTWEAVAAQAEQGGVTFRLTSLSPVVITEVKEGADATTATTAAGTTDASKAPKTGEF